MNTVRTILLSGVYCFLPLVAFISCVAILSKEYKLWKALLACLLGMLPVLPIAMLQTPIDDMLKNLDNKDELTGVLISAIVLNGLIEECIKALLLFVLPASITTEKKAKRAFFLYALTAGLAFGCLETFFYLIGGTQGIGLRMVTAVVIHVFCTGLGGLFVFSVKSREPRILPLIFAILAHGIYNYFAGFDGSPYFYISFVAILFSIMECRVRYMRP